MADFDDALRAWRGSLGHAEVVTDGALLASAETATYPTTQRVRAILRPASREAVQTCLRVANEHRVPVYPVSTGKNWGYGSRVPPRDGSVVLDLAGMDRIVDFDEGLAYVTVEPGVTQAQLYAYLQARGSRLWMDATGSTPLASLVGNIVERGFGVTPYGDHVGRACGYEVVLPTGDLLHTGFGTFAGSRVAPLDRWSPGPLLEGLFSQSSLGVVTKLTIPLMPSPDVAQTAMFDMDDEPSLAAGVDAMLRLQLEGTIRAAPWFGNHFRLLAVTMRYPWSEGIPPPLAPPESLRLAARYGIPPWTGAVGLYGSAGQVELARQQVAGHLEGRVRALRFVDEASLAAADISPRRTIELAMHRGYTGQLMNAVRRAYWRKRTAPSADADLDRDGVGFVFVNASIPFSGSDVVAAARQAEEVVLAHGLEPAVNCHSIRERVLQLLVSIAYDRDVAGDDERALASHDELSARWREAGYFPFRLGLHSMAAFSEAEASHRATVRALKRALDPNGILAPGRYDGD